MDNMIPFAVIHGRQWYICRDCGHKEMKKYDICPVCKNEHEADEQKKLAFETLMLTAGGINDVFHN